LSLYRECFIIFNLILMTTVGIEPGTLANALIICAVQDFSLPHSVQTGSGAHPISYPMGEADLHLVPRSRMVELYLHSPICLHGIVLN
jgi:hypothetical protein